MFYCFIHTVANVQKFVSPVCMEKMFFFFKEEVMVYCKEKTQKTGNFSILQLNNKPHQL